MSQAGSPPPSVLVPLRNEISGSLERPAPGVTKLQVTTAPVPKFGSSHLLPYPSPKVS